MIRVVGLPGDQTDPVMVVARKPARHEVVGQPASPADNQHVLYEKLDHGHRHVNKCPWREDEHQLIPERRFVATFDGIKPGAIEEVEPHQNADLGLIDDDEKHHHGDGDQPLRAGVDREGPDACLRAVVGVEVAIGDPRDLFDRRQLRHRIDQDRENRHRERQRISAPLPRPGSSATARRAPPPRRGRTRSSRSKRCRRRL